MLKGMRSVWPAWISYFPGVQQHGIMYHSKDMYDTAPLTQGDETAIR